MQLRVVGENIKMNDIVIVTENVTEIGFKA